MKMFFSLMVNVYEFGVGISFYILLFGIKYDYNMTIL